MRNHWPNEDTERRVQAALQGPASHVVRTIVGFPNSRNAAATPPLQVKP